MPESSTVEFLNRLLSLHSRSLPTYLASARPWFPQKSSEIEAVLRLIADDQRLMVDHIAAVIMDQHGTIQRSEFPMEFTDLHDLSVDYLLPRVIDRQQREIAWMRSGLADLQDEPAARAVAEEALGAAQAHLDSLLEVSGESPVKT